MYCDKLGIMMSPNKRMSGKIADTLAYGFSGKRPYHFSRIYLRPWAVKIESGNIKNITASGRKLVTTRVNTSKSDAIELRDAKNPLVVENRPMRAIAKVGKLISGDKKMLSTLVRHESNGRRPVLRFPIIMSGVKPRAVKSSVIVLPLLMILIMSAARPEITMSAVMIRGIFGKDLRTKRR